MRIFSYLYAVMISETWSPDDLNDWITDVMTVNENYPHELYDLLYVNDLNKITEKLRDLYWIKEKNGYDRFCVPEVVLGYYCLQYFSGKTSLKECVKLCGLYADYGSVTFFMANFCDVKSAFMPRKSLYSRYDAVIRVLPSAPPLQRHRFLLSSEPWNKC